MGEKERWFFPNFGEQFVEVVRCGRTFARGNALAGRDIFQQAVFGIVDELAFLAFFYVFHGEAQLFANLIIGIAVEVGDASVDVEHDGNGAEGVLAGLFFVVEKAFRQRFFIFLTADDVQEFFFDYAVDAECAGFERFPVQQAHQPARGNRAILWRRFGDVG